jgi:hypothetical protein
LPSGKNWDDMYQHMFSKMKEYFGVIEKGGGRRIE